MVALPSDAPPPRLCLVKKDWPEQEYGYNLHAERGKGQFIGNVDPGSPADKAGLIAGDRIYAVNGVSIANESHKQVVARIKENPLQCELLVIDEEGERWYREHKIDITPEMALAARNGQQVHVDRSVHPEPSPMNGTSNGYDATSSSPSPVDSSSTSPPPTQWYTPPAAATTRVVEPVRPMMGNPDGRPLPRLSHLVKKSPNDEFGFNLHAEKGRGHFIGKVDTGGIGDKAGLVMGQRIVGVNGELIFPSTPHKDVVYLIKKDPLHTALLVASEDVDQWYKERGAQYSFDLAETFGERPSTHSYQPQHTALTYVPPTIVEPDAVSESSSSAEESEAGEDDHEDHHQHQPAQPPPPVAPAVTIPPPDYEATTHVSNGHPAPTHHQLNYEEHKPEPMHAPAPAVEKTTSSSPPVYATLNKPVNSPAVSPKPTVAPTKPQISPSGNPQLDSAFGMSATEMRAQLARRKKADPRKDSSLSIQEKHRVVTNM